MSNGNSEETTGSTPTADETTAPSVEQLQQKISELSTAVESERQGKAHAQRYIAAMVAKMEEKAAEVDTSGNKTNEADKAEQFLEIFRDNPQAALDAHFNARMRPIFTEHLANQEVLYKERAIEKIGQEDWAPYKDEIEEYMSQFDPSIRAKPGAWENAYKIVVAGNLDKEVDRRSEQKQKRLKQEQESVLEGSGAASSRAGRNAPMSDLEKKLAKEFNMSDKEWQTSKQSIVPWDKPMR